MNDATLAEHLLLGARATATLAHLPLPRQLAVLSLLENRALDVGVRVGGPELGNDPASRVLNLCGAVALQNRQPEVVS